MDRPSRPAASSPRLVTDDFGRVYVVGAVRVTVAPPEPAAFAVEARVREEDTHLLLGPNPVALTPEPDLDGLARAAARSRALDPGSVLVRPGDPLEFLAVVHDVDRDPTWCEAWVERALDGVFELAATHRVSALALPLLGTQFGHACARRVAHLTVQSLERVSPRSLRRLWLQAPAAATREILAGFDTRIAG